MRARDNPFAVERLHALRFRGADHADLWDALSRAKRGALVGHEGAGKTTLMLELAAHARTRCHDTVWLQLHRAAGGLTREHRDKLARLAPSDVLFVDGADHMTIPDRWRIGRARGLVLATLHAPAQWLPTLRHLTTSAALLDELTRELTGGSLEQLGIDRDALYARHDGNVRAAFRELYDRV